jgi:hypothetical protein
MSNESLVAGSAEQYGKEVHDNLPTSHITDFLSAVNKTGDFALHIPDDKLDTAIFEATHHRILQSAYTFAGTSIEGNKTEIHYELPDWFATIITNINELSQDLPNVVAGRPAEAGTFSILIQTPKPELGYQFDPTDTEIQISGEAVDPENDDIIELRNINEYLTHDWELVGIFGQSSFSKVELRLAQL